jgi:hypothetical protein
MALVFNGDGTITGISVGGLPDGIVDTDMLATSAVATAKIADDAVTVAKTGFTGDLQFNSGYGSAATAYGCRAWINFDGTSPSIGSGRGSGNVSTVADINTGDYIVNFATAMPDANYSVVATGDNTNALIVRLSNNEAVPAAGSVRLSTVNTSFAATDILFCMVAILR